MAEPERCKCGTDAMGGCRIHDRRAFYALQESNEKALQALADETSRLAAEIDGTYASLRSVIENCKHIDSTAIRHQLVGLMPEVRELDEDLVKRMRENGQGALVARHQHFVREGWAGFGYPDATTEKQESADA